MIPHHQQAIEMADLALAPKAEGGMAGMDMGGVTEDGMMTAEQLAQLTAATGSAFDDEWLTLMITHHQGAIAMAQQVKAESQNPQVIAMADAIVTSQTAEITEMQQALGE